MKKLLAVVILSLSFSLFGCAGLFNPEIEENVVGEFIQTNNQTLSVLYEEFFNINNFTDAEKKQINSGIAFIMGNIDYLNHLSATGGIDYQSMKVTFKMSTKRFYEIKPLLDREISRVNVLTYKDGEIAETYIHDGKARALYYQMDRNVTALLAEGNGLIAQAEKEIQQTGQEGFIKVVKQFYEVLSPLLL